MRYIHLRNFRCFDDFRLDLRSRVNLLVGDNAAGKTSFLAGCKYAISSFFSGFSDSNTRWTSPGVNDFKMDMVQGRVMPARQLIIDFLPWPGSVDHTQRVAKKSEKNSKALKGGIREFKKYSRLLYETFTGPDGQLRPLPLFAAFTTEDIHKNRSIAAEKYKDYTPRHSFGYYECLNANGLLKYWMQRLLVLREDEREDEIGIVRKAIISALGENGCRIIRDIHIRPLRRKVFFVQWDGRELESELLSDGYRRLVNIVADLAFRAAILNGPLYGEETLERTHGTVLIDELDLHLHPELQNVIVDSLSRTFPGLQFIVSSHSPLVMSSVRSGAENVVYRMQYDPEEKKYIVWEMNTYGHDSTDILEQSLGLPARTISVDRRLNEVTEAIDHEDFSEAASMIAALREEFGNNLPGLAERETILHLLWSSDNAPD